jgi:hypothetical protein
MNCRYNPAFLVASGDYPTCRQAGRSPEPGASLCGANLPGDWAFRLRSWSYGGTSVCLASRRAGIALAKTGFRHCLTLARRSASARRHASALLSRPSLQQRRLPSTSTYVNDINYQPDSRTGDLHPISSRPCRAYTCRSSGWFSATAELAVSCLWKIDDSPTFRLRNARAGSD